MKIFDNELNLIEQLLVEYLNNEVKDLQFTNELFDECIKKYDKLFDIFKIISQVKVVDGPISKYVECYNILQDRRLLLIHGLTLTDTDNLFKFKSRFEIYVVDMKLDILKNLKEK